MAGTSPAMTNGRLGAGEILLRKHLAFFHRRLIERIDAEQVRGNDRFQHEMHHQLAETFFTELVDMDRAHRAAVLCKSLSGCTAFRSHQIANGLAGKSRLTRKFRQLAVHVRSEAFAVDRDHSEQFVARSIDEQLQLTMLIDRSKSRQRCGALAFLPETFRPELYIPMRKALEAVTIGHQHVD